jgi:FeS assembly protein IscX
MKWLDVEDIAEALEEEYPNIDIYALRFTELHKYVINLEGFDDEPNKSNEKILEAIQGEWFEIRNNK